MNKLTAKQLLLINQKLNKSTECVYDAQRLAEIAENPYRQNEKSFYVYKSVSMKAAVLGSDIVRYKPFAEKNNQTAVVAMMTLLEINSYYIVGYESDLPLLIEYLTASDAERIDEWIAAHKASKESGSKQ